MNNDSRAFAALDTAHNRFLSSGDPKAAQKVSDLYRALSGGCRPAGSHTWPVSGPWCYCGREKWRNQ